MQVELKNNKEEQLTEIVKEPAKKSTVPKRQQKNLTNKLTSQDAQYVNHISYLSQLSYFNLMEMECVELCRDHQHNMKMLANKKVIKLSPEMKYFTCKKCELMLVPGETARVRIKSKRNKHVVLTCLNCDTIKRYDLAGIKK